MSFLQGGTEMSEGGTDQIIGIVETMLETMQSDLADAEKSEASAVETYNGLMQAKNQETSQATKAIETKMGRSGELAVSMATGGADLEDSKEALDEDTKTKASLKTTCEQKTKEFVERRSNRADEVTALSETIKILNDDSALDLFKKTMPSTPSPTTESGVVFLQLSAKSKSGQFTRMMEGLVAQDTPHAANYKLVLYAASSKAKTKNPYDQIGTMIDNMIALLGREQGDDDKQKEFCDGELRKANEEKSATEDDVRALGTEVDKCNELIETAEAEIRTLKQGIQELDQAVAQATEQRKQEHADFSAASAANQAALELLEMAKNRMNKFYNPSLYVDTATQPPIYGFMQEGPLTFVQVSMHTQVRKQQAGGVVQLLAQMMGDVQTSQAESKHDEEEAQKEYEETMTDASAKRATDSKLLVSKDTLRADLVARLDDTTSDKTDAEKRVQGLLVKIGDLHAACDFLIDNYDLRKEARTGEVEGLHQGKAVLEGLATPAEEPASAGFLQRNL